MKFRRSLMFAFTAATLLSGAAAVAQDMPASPPPPSTMPAPDSAAMRTPHGEVTVNSAPAKAPDIAPAPPFEQLSNGGKSISEDQAEAYPPLANDFVHADGNRDGKVSKAEYQRWIKQL
jgi:hypothetical protein